MARIRTIKPKFWDDLKLGKVSRDARLTYIGLWNFSDDLGTVLADPNWIKAKLYPYDELVNGELKNWLAELTENKFMFQFEYKGAKYFHIPKLTEHQVINKPNFQDLFISKNDLTPILEQSSINPVSIPESDGNIPTGKGKEGKGIGKERRGEERQKNESVIYNIEEYLLNHRHELEIICMGPPLKTEEHVLGVLKKYHLWHQSKESYPKAPLPLIAGLKTWLLNEKNFSNGTHKPTTSRNSKQAGAINLLNDLKSDLTDIARRKKDS